MSAAPATPRKNDLLGSFVHHPVAANLLMLILIIAGLFAASRLNVQFFPNFNLDVVTVRVEWRGAAAEDVEEGITTPLEQKLKTVAGLDKLTSTSSQGMASISLCSPGCFSTSRCHWPSSWNWPTGLCSRSRRQPDLFC